MLIEYKIRFDGDSITISQRIEPDSGAGNAPAPEPASDDGNGVITRELPQSFEANAAAADSGLGAGTFDKSGVGGGTFDKSGVGGGEPGMAPIVIFGPIILGGTLRPKLRPDAPAE